MNAQGAGKLQTRFRRVVRPVAKQLWRFHLEGFERLPTEGPAILCPNHISFLDSAFLMLHVPRNISFVGKAEYMDSWKTKFIFPAMGMIPIDRGGGDKSQAALDTAERVLRRGELFGIFPEGTRSRDGQLGPFLPAAARYLRGAAWVVPVVVRGTDALFGRDERFRPQPVQVAFGEAFDPGAVVGDAKTAALEEARRRVLGVMVG